MAGEVDPCLCGGGRVGKLSDGGWSFDCCFVPPDFSRVVSKEMELKYPGAQLFLRATTLD